MLFLSPDQQRQSTEGSCLYYNSQNSVCVQEKENIYVAQSENALKIIGKEFPDLL